MLKSDAALKKLNSCEPPLGYSAEPVNNRNADEIVQLRGLRGYAIQIDHIVARLNEEGAASQLWLVDNLAVETPPNADEQSRLISLVWQQRKHLRGAKIAWVTQKACGADTTTLQGLPVNLRTFKTLKGARAWLRGKA